MAVTLKEFHPFPNLPFELRAKIWKDAATEPRIVVITATETCPRHFWRVEYRTADPVPPTLYASRESREEALKHFELSFKGRTEEMEDIKGTIYINFDVDTLYFRSTRSSSYDGPVNNYSLTHLLFTSCFSWWRSPLFRISKLIIDTCQAEYPADYYARQCIMKMTSLKELYIIDASGEYSRPGGNFRDPLQSDLYKHELYLGNVDDDTGRLPNALAARFRHDWEQERKESKDQDAPKPVILAKKLLRKVRETD